MTVSAENEQSMDESNASQRMQSDGDDPNEISAFEAETERLSRGIAQMRSHLSNTTSRSGGGARGRSSLGTQASSDISSRSRSSPAALRGASRTPTRGRASHPAGSPIKVIALGGGRRSASASASMRSPAAVPTKTSSLRSTPESSMIPRSSSASGYARAAGRSSSQSSLTPLRRALSSPSAPSGGGAKLSSIAGQRQFGSDQELAPRNRRLHVDVSQDGGWIQTEPSMDYSRQTSIQSVHTEIYGGSERDDDQVEQSFAAALQRSEADVNGSSVANQVGVVDPAASAVPDPPIFGRRRSSSLPMDTLNPIISTGSHAVPAVAVSSSTIASSSMVTGSQSISAATVTSTSTSGVSSVHRPVMSMSAIPSDQPNRIGTTAFASAVSASSNAPRVVGGSSSAIAQSSSFTAATATGGITTATVASMTSTPGLSAGSAVPMAVSVIELPLETEEDWMGIQSSAIEVAAPASTTASQITRPVRTSTRGSSMGSGRFSSEPTRSTSPAAASSVNIVAASSSVASLNSPVLPQGPRGRSESHESMSLQRSSAVQRVGGPAIVSSGSSPKLVNTTFQPTSGIFLGLCIHVLADSTVHMI